MYRSVTIGVLILLIFAGLSACAPATASEGSQTLVLYSGRSESLVLPIIEQFEAATGIDVEVKWGGTPELAATLLEEGENSPADVFFAQDPGGLGAVRELLQPLPAEILEQVQPLFRDPEGRWVGTSGRARVLVYNTAALAVEDLPQDLHGLTDPQWRGRIGWAPTNGSFQTMVTAMRTLWGEEQTRQWLVDMQANQPVVFEGNTPIVAAAGVGEIDLGLVNHYYLYRFLAEEGQEFSARNYHLPGSGPGSLVMTAGVGVLQSSRNSELAQRFVAFLLSPVAQQYFTSQTYEYPVVEGVVVDAELTPLTEIQPPDITPADLADLQGTVTLLQETGVLP